MFKSFIPENSVKSKVFTISFHESKNNIREGTSDFDLLYDLKFLTIDKN